MKHYFGKILNFKNLSWCFVVVAFALLFFVGLIFTSCEQEPNINPITGEEVEEGELPARPIMVSVPNAPDGAVPQSNLSKADIIYEFPVEAELTRLQVVYYSEFPEMVGPVRSVRYYFVNLAAEYQACHVGYGWGKFAHDNMNNRKIPHINGMEDGELFDRVDFKQAPNNAYISWDKIMERAEEESWFETKAEIRPWLFRDDNWKESLDKNKEKAQKVIDKKKDSDDPEDKKEVKQAEGLLADPVKASSVAVKSSGCNSECVYDSESDKYKRYWYGDPYIDRETGKQLEFDNILVQFVESTPLVNHSTGMNDYKGRIKIDMQSEGDALLFTDGEVIKGTWSKNECTDRTIFVDEYGNEFRFSQGKTWVYICDQHMSCTYK